MGLTANLNFRKLKETRKRSAENISLLEKLRIINYRGATLALTHGSLSFRNRLEIIKVLHVILQ